MRRTIFASNDTAVKMKLAKQKKIDIYSFFPIDPGDCVCAKMISEWQDKLRLLPPNLKDAEIAKLKSLTCPRDKTGMMRFEISCKNCGQVQGYCWATDPSLSDFCDFHYAQWTNGKEWYGCLTPNISPITQQLTIECTCGADTRDFRANQTLSGKVANRIEEENKIGREFGKSNSKFGVVAI